MRGGGGGGSGGGGGAAALDRNKQVSAATDADKGAICDWFASMIGGYGATIDCRFFTDYVPTSPDRATCIATFPNCTATVGQYQDCLVDQLPLLNECSQLNLDNARLQPECQAAAGCF